MGTLAEVVEEHVAWVEDLALELGLDDEDLVALAAGTTRRLSDPIVRIAIVGEHASGASSLVNALCRTAILPTSTDASTATITTICSGAGEVTVEFDSWDRTFVLPQSQQVLGQIVTSTFHIGWPTDLVGQVQLLSSDPRVAPRVELLAIGRSTELLDAGVEILDLPGIDTVNRHHARLVRRALTDQADLVVVLVSAIAGVTSSLRTFLEAELDGLLHRAVFCLTGSDDLNGRQLDERLAQVRRDLAAIISPGEPVVLPVGADPALRSFLAAEPEAPWADALTRFEAHLLEVVHRARGDIVAESSARRADRLLARLDTLLDEVEVKLRASQDEATRDAGAELEEVIVAWLPVAHPIVEQAAADHVAKAISTSKRLGEARLGESIKPLVYGATLKDLPEILTDKVTAELALLHGQVTRVVDQPTRSITTRVQELCGSLAKAMQPRLDVLAVRSRMELELPPPRFAPNPRPAARQVDLADVVARARLAAKDETIDKRGNTGVGALIGTFVMPGVGTLVGAALGAAAGKKSDESILAEKNAVVRFVDEAVAAEHERVSVELDGLVAAAGVALDQHVAACRAAWKDALDVLAEAGAIESAHRDLALQECRAIRHDIADRRAALRGATVS